MCNFRLFKNFCFYGDFNLRFTNQVFFSLDGFQPKLDYFILLRKRHISIIFKNIFMIYFKA